MMFGSQTWLEANSDEYEAFIKDMENGDTGFTFEDPADEGDLDATDFGYDVYAGGPETDEPADMYGGWEDCIE